MKILKDDTVQIMLGKDRGKTGKVLQVLPKDDRVVVEGVNTYKRHVRRMGQNEGGIVDLVKPVSLSNVMVVCPNCKKTTRVGFKVEGSEKLRVCKRCGEVLKKGGKA